MKYSIGRVYLEVIDEAVIRAVESPDGADELRQLFALLKDFDQKWCNPTPLNKE